MPIRSFFYVALASFASMISLRVGDPMLPVIASSFNRSVGEAGMLLSSFALAYGILQMVYGPLGDRLGKLRVIVIGSLGAGLAAFWAASAQQFESLLLARIVMGGASASIIPMGMAWIGDNVPYAERQVVLARLLSATVCGMLLGQAAGGWFADTLGWRAAFWVLGVLFLCAAALLWLSQRHSMPAPPPPAGQGNALALLRLPRVRWVLGVVAIEGALVFGPVAFTPAKLMARLDISATQAGIILALFAIGGLLYSAQARRWLARLGERGLARGGGLVLGLAVLTLGLTPWVLLALPACFLFGTGYYMLHATLQTQATQMAPAARGMAMASFACALFLGQAVGVTVFAYAFDLGLAVPAFVLAALGLVALGHYAALGVGPGTSGTPAVPTTTTRSP